MARPGYSLAVKAGGGGQVKTLLVPLTSFNLEAFIDGTMAIKMPETGKIIGIDLSVGLRGGTHVTSTVDVLEGATSLLAAVFNVASLTPLTAVAKEGSALAAAADVVAKDAEINITVVEDGGTNPTWGAVNVQIDYVPLGD